MSRALLADRYQGIHAGLFSGYANMASQFDDLINFSIGDPDLACDEGIINAAFADAKAGYTHYTPASGYPELRRAIAESYKEDYDLDFTADEVFICASASHGLLLVLEAILNPGEEVLLIAPYFSSYAGQVKLARGVPVEVDTTFEEGFQVNVERLEAAVTPRTRAIILNTPCNPTGVCLSRENMAALADFAKRHDLIVVADDIYTIFSYGEPFLPIVSLPGMRERTVTLNSFSKNYLMTGWRIGSILAPAPFIDAVREINEGIIYCAPSISQRAALYALRHRSEICPPIAAEYKKRLNYCAERINAIPKMHVLTPPGGTFYLFVDVRETGLSSEEVVMRLLHEAHVLTIPGSGFGKCGEGFLRLACTIDNEKAGEAFDRIAKMPLFQK